MLFKQPDPFITDSLKWHGLKQSAMFMWYKTREIDPLIHDDTSSAAGYAAQKDSLKWAMMSIRNGYFRYVAPPNATAQGDDTFKAMRASLH